VNGNAALDAIGVNETGKGLEALIQNSVVQLLLTYGPFYKNATTRGPLSVKDVAYKTTDSQQLKLKREDK